MSFKFTKKKKHSLAFACCLHVAVRKSKKSDQFSETILFKSIL